MFGRLHSAVLQNKRPDRSTHASWDTDRYAPHAPSTERLLLRPQPLE